MSTPPGRSIDDLIPKLAENWKASEPTVFVAILENFDTEINQVTFPDGTTIRVLEDHELESLGFRFVAFDLALSFLEANLQKSYAAVITAIADDLDEAITAANEKFRRVALSLQLVKAEDVHVGAVWAHQPGVKNSARLITSLSPTFGGVPVYKSRYTLASEDLPVLTEVYRGLTGHFSKATDVAFRRYETGRRRSLREDKLIDYWIGLESLFSKKNETQELGFKFALRIAHYIGDSSVDRFDRFKSMKHAYNVRSKVVHGEGSRTGVDDAASSTEEALRESLRRAAMDGRLPNLEQLDKRAATGTR